MTGMYAMHYAVSGCPIAAKNKISGAQTKVCTSGPPEPVRLVRQWPDHFSS